MIWCLAVLVVLASAKVAEDDIFDTLAATATATTATCTANIGSPGGCTSVETPFCTSDGCALNCNSSLAGSCKDPRTPVCGSPVIGGPGLCYSGLNGFFNGAVISEQSPTPNPPWVIWVPIDVRARASSLQGPQRLAGLWFYALFCPATWSCTRCLAAAYCRTAPFDVLPSKAALSDAMLAQTFFCPNPLPEDAKLVGLTLQQQAALLQSMCPTKGSPKGLLGLLGLLGLIPLLMCLACLLCLLLRRKKREGDVHFATFDTQATASAIVPPMMPPPVAPMVPTTFGAPCTAGGPLTATLGGAPCPAL